MITNLNNNNYIFHLQNNMLTNLNDNNYIFHLQNITTDKIFFYLNYLLWAYQHLAQVHGPPLGPKHGSDLFQILGPYTHIFIN